MTTEEALAGRLARIWTPEGFKCTAVDIDQKLCQVDLTLCLKSEIEGGDIGRFYFRYSRCYERYVLGAVIDDGNGEWVVDLLIDNASKGIEDGSNRQWLEPQARCYRAEFANRWLPHFRRGLFLSGFPVECSAHEELEWNLWLRQREGEAP